MEIHTVKAIHEAHLDERWPEESNFDINGICKICFYICPHEKTTYQDDSDSGEFWGGKYFISLSGEFCDNCGSLIERDYDPYEQEELITAE